MSTRKSPDRGQGSKNNSAANDTARSAAFQDGELIAEIEKNSREVYRIHRRQFKGHELVDVRVWYDDAVTGEPRPGKGVALKLEAVPAIIAALQQAAQRRTAA